MQSEDQSMELDRVDELPETSRNIAREPKSDVRKDIYVGFRVLLKYYRRHTTIYNSGENRK